jgi:Protein of unknown function (DUF3099)
MRNNAKSRKRIYLAMMAICLLLYVVSWTVIVRFSTTASIVVSIAAMAIPPVAVIIANRGDDT